MQSLDTAMATRSKNDVVTISMKDLNAVVELAVKKSIDLLRDEFVGMFDERLKAISNRLSVIEQSQQNLATSLNDVTERYFGLETKVATMEKSLETLSANSSDVRVDRLQEQVRDGMIMTNDVEQYSRRNNIRIHGMHPNADGTSTDAVLTVIRDKLHIQCEADDIESSHPLPKKSSQPTAAIIVRFRSRKKREEVLRCRRNLKGTSISISEDLTNLNMQLLNRLKSNDKIRSCWSWNGRIFATDATTGNKFLFKPFCDIDKVLAR
jgi:archaellum component FlaC